MSRRKTKRQRSYRPLRIVDSQTMSNKSDGRWVTRPVRAGKSQKEYLCPGCNRTIPIGQAHIVAWPHTPPIGSSSGLEHRRHWHNSCWDRRR